MDIAPSCRRVYTRGIIKNAAGAAEGELSMKRTKMMGRIAVAACLMLLAAVVCFTATACGISEYSAAIELTDAMGAEEKEVYVSGTSMKKYETRLVVDGDSYTLTKLAYGGDQTDENLIDEAYWYTSYQMAFCLEFKGTCSTDGDKVTLEAPSEATKLVYYQFDVSALYPSRFPLKMTTGENKDPVAMTATDGDMKYFNGLYIEVTDKTSAEKQTVTVDGDKIVSVS